MFDLQKHCVDLYSAWDKAGQSVELHIYAGGNPGFGISRKTFLLIPGHTGSRTGLICLAI
jgi:hypothetical protein